VDGDTVVFDGTGVALGNYDGLIRVGGSYAVVDGFEVVNSRGGGIQLVAANQTMIRRCKNSQHRVPGARRLGQRHRLAAKRGV
jgi:hypothetical protein